MEQSVLRSFEARCIQEEPPACQTMCPLHVEARTFTSLMAEGRFAEARKCLERSMPLAGLTGYLCTGECMAHCLRSDKGGGINMPMLERACLALSPAGKTLALPASGKSVAVAGAGLSSLCLAWELGKKGCKVVVFHTNTPGGRLASQPLAELPARALPEALEQLGALRVLFQEVRGFDPAWRDKVLGEYESLYLGLDDPGVRLADFGLADISSRLTGETAHERIFAGGLPREGGASHIWEASDGKRAAGSVTRLLQGVSPASARDKEDVYPTLLYTDSGEVPDLAPVLPLDPLQPSAEEARREAARCIQCQCLECVKRCAYLAAYKGYPKRYAREIYNNLSVVHGLRRTNSQINSCAECGLCAAVCPHDADMGAFCAEARKEMVRSKRMPPSAHEFALEDMAFSNGDDIAFLRHQPGHTGSAALFFPGCQLPASMPEQTERLYAFLAAQPSLGKGGLGLWFRCCAAPARWSGRPQLTGKSVAELRKAWVEAGKPLLILACASCMAFFKAELPEIPLRSLWELLSTFPLPPEAAPLPGGLALHDPCANRDEAEVRNSVRTLAAGLKQEVEELPLGRELTRCCGYGGLAAAANPSMGEAYALSRAEDTQGPILSYCIMCRDRLRAVGKDSLHMLDLLFPASATAEEPASGAMLAARRPAPGISRRQEARLDFRRRMLLHFWNEQPLRDPPMEDLVLHMDDAVAQKLEARRILHTDVKAVILYARDKGALFHNAENGRSLSSLRPKQVTFWVEYSEQPDKSCVIHDAYCHRMVVPGVPGRGLPTACSEEGYAPKGGRM
ncbi:4Fe-4S dicluster domain-containing protein [Desulfovibrio sp. OttesenSCG-928-A18]|nr:4Fe-4S dicluster domain-containing protein [Desulfovibrio sp. OttesenSCG-928-A18]